jgi:hypothetical protein
MKSLNPDYLTVQDAQAQFGLHPSTIRKYSQMNLLRGFRIGFHGKLYLLRTDVEKLFKGEQGALK